MADKIFQALLINGFRFTQKNKVINPRYNTVPFDDKVDKNCLNGPYLQPWQTNDIVPIQILSDYPLTLKFYNYNSYNSIFADTIFSTVGINEVVDFPIIGVTYTAYEAFVDFSTFPPGNYYGEISYTNDDSQVIVWQTSPLNIQVNQPKTLLYEYRNTENDFGAIFDTGITFCLRVEGNIRNYAPSSLDEIFDDQNYNTTTESSLPFRLQTNTIGLAKGMPDWILDKMNIIFSCNTKSIDGTFYNKVEGAKFEMTRPDAKQDNEDGWMSIQIIQQDNFFIQQFQVGQTPNEGDIKVIVDCKIFDNVGASFSIADIFTTNVNLIRIALENKGLDTFTMKLGTTLGANDIDEFNVGVPDESDIVAVTETLDIKHLFKVTATLFITVPDGVSLKVTPVWEKYDAISVSPSTPVAAFPKGYCGEWDGSDADFAINWDITTGLGNVDTPWIGCALRDGRNGTRDMTGAFVMGFDRTTPLTRGTFVGSAGNEVLITTNELPASSLKMFAVDVNSTPNDQPNPDQAVAWNTTVPGSSKNYEILKSNNDPINGKTSNMGLGNPLDITNYSLISVLFQKITD